LSRLSGLGDGPAHLTIRLPALAVAKPHPRRGGASRRRRVPRAARRAESSSGSPSDSMALSSEMSLSEDSRVCIWSRDGCEGPLYADQGGGLLGVSSA
jgi:hypothetical protein